MSGNREDRIRERAHQIRQRENMPEGQNDTHWEQATREIEAEEAAGVEGGEAPARAREGKPDPALSGAVAPTASGASGLASGLQPGGSAPSASPAAGAGSIGTGGGSTADQPTGTVKRGI